MAKPQESAGGVGAILSTLKHAFRQMGVARSAKALLQVNQKHGFDCPGCAWPDPDDRRAMVEFCENGAKAVAEEATRKRITSAFFQKHSVVDLRTAEEFWLSQQGRLTEPMWLPPGADHYEPITWESAFRLIAQELRSLGSPNEAIFYTSGRTSNEAAFLYQLFVRLFGTNNLPDCSNLCHESSGVALKDVIGIGKGTVTLEDFNHADCIVVIGQNPGSNHPRMLTALQQAARNGCQIISINPLNETGLRRFKHPQELSGWVGKGTQLASLHLPVRINGDVALLKGILKELLIRERQSPGSVVSSAFITEKTEGFTDFVADLEATPWEHIVGASGIDVESIQQAAGIIARSKRLICCWAMGLTQHKNAVSNIQEILNLLLLGGHFGRPGAGACPVRGHSNVQGDRTMGIWEKPPAEFLQRLGQEFQFTPPAAHGHDTVEAIQAMDSGQAKVFIGLGGNFLSASPDTEYTARALSRCQLTVQISTKLNRSHAFTGRQALILPCLGRTERDVQGSGEQLVSVENSMGVVHASRGNLNPASTSLKSEVAIVAGIAEATLGPSAALNWAAMTNNYDLIRDRIAKVIPGFDGFNARLRAPGGFYLPNPVRDTCTFETASGKARFTLHPIEPWSLALDEYLMMTIRSHDQYNTTIYGHDDRYRGISGNRRVVLMNAEDMKGSNLNEGDRVDLVSHFNGEIRRALDFAVVPYPIPTRCVGTYFPETNVLVPIRSTADKSNTPTYKSVVVSLAPRSMEVRS